MLTDTEARIIPLRRNRDAEQARTLRGQVPLAGRRALTVRRHQPGLRRRARDLVRQAGLPLPRRPATTARGPLPVEPSSEANAREPTAHRERVRALPIVYRQPAPPRGDRR